MDPLKLLLRLATSAAAALQGAITIATARGGPGDVKLQPGDLAPDFTLQGSDDRTYRLSELVVGTRAVVMAWFPKAFTGG